MIKYVILLPKNFLLIIFLIKKISFFFFQKNFNFFLKKITIKTIAKFFFFGKIFKLKKKKNIFIPFIHLAHLCFLTNVFLKTKQRKKKKKFFFKLFCEKSNFNLNMLQRMKSLNVYTNRGFWINKFIKSKKKGKISTYN